MSIFHSRSSNQSFWNQRCLFEIVKFHAPSFACLDLTILFNVIFFIASNFDKTTWIVKQIWVRKISELAKGVSIERINFWNFGPYPRRSSSLAMDLWIKSDKCQRQSLYNELEKWKITFESTWLTRNTLQPLGSVFNMALWVLLWRNHCLSKVLMPPRETWLFLFRAALATFRKWLLSQSLLLSFENCLTPNVNLPICVRSSTWILIAAGKSSLIR